MAHINGRAVQIECALDNVDRPHHSSAETAWFGQDYAQLFSVFGGHQSEPSPYFRFTQPPHGSAIGFAVSVQIATCMPIQKGQIAPASVQEGACIMRDTGEGGFHTTAPVDDGAGNIGAFLYA